MTIVLKSPSVSTAAGLSKFRLDPVLADDNGGVKFLFDFATTVGWPDQDAPVNGDTIKNIATTTGLMTLGNGSMNITSGQTVAFAGGGVDFTGLTSDPVEVVGPAGALTSIYDAANDYFLMCCYMKMPSSTDWNKSASLAPIFCATTASNGYVSEADLFTLSMQLTGPALNLRRQTNGATIQTLDFTNLTNVYGRVCQIAVWRDASGVFIRVKSAAGEATASTAVGSNNAGDFSAKQPRWGVPGSFNNLATLTEHRATHKTRLYRGWIEDLTASGRSPLTVLDADWARVQARKTASGDTIFV